MSDRERPFYSFLEETFKEYYGIHRWRLRSGIILTAISSPGWQSFFDNLRFISSTDQVVASPELITSTEIDLDNLVAERKLIEQRIDQVKAVSARFPKVTILLGTPIFKEDEKPTNSVIFLRAGEIITRTNKRAGVTDWEKVNFKFIAEEPPVLIPEIEI